MKKIYIWGTGKYSELVYKSVNKETCNICGFVDNDKAKQGGEWIENIKIVSPELLLEVKFDHILISVKNYGSILDQCIDMGFDNDQISVFWKSDCEIPYIDTRKILLEMDLKLDRCKRKLENYPYELGLGKQLKIKSSIELLKKVIGEKVSVCRFGDGELDIMRGKERPWFQNKSDKLSDRLKEVFRSRESNIIIAVSNNFGSLECYTEDAADEIRDYLYNGNREEIIDWFDSEYTYYDAYVSRPYIIYKNKEQAQLVFDMLKIIWNNRNILVVEGIYVRMGVSNNLFNNAKNVRRIVCPAINAFEYYDKIIDSIRQNVMENELILISLGPTATILAYDLAKDGLQTFDIGQIDNEYEWFLRKADKRIQIPGKSVAEIDEYRLPKEIIVDYEYENQIVDRII